MSRDLLTPIRPGAGSLLSRRLAGQRNGAPDRLAEAQRKLDEADEARRRSQAGDPSTPTGEPSRTPPTSPDAARPAEKWLGERLSAEREAVLRLSAGVLEARAAALAAQQEFDATKATFARESTPAGWKAVGAARDAADRADVRLQGLAADHVAAIERLDVQEHDALRQLRSELARDASGAGLPLDGLRQDLERVLEQLRLLAVAIDGTVQARNAARRSADEITGYLGDSEAFVSAPQDPAIVAGWATRAGCGRYTDAEIAHVVSAIVRDIGPGGRGEQRSPLRLLVRSLHLAAEPAPAPIVIEEPPTESEVPA